MLSVEFAGLSDAFRCVNRNSGTQTLLARCLRITVTFPTAGHRRMLATFPPADPVCMKTLVRLRHDAFALCLICFTVYPVIACANEPTLEQIKADGASRSVYLQRTRARQPSGPPTANLVGFRKHIQPLLKKTCVQCHGPDVQEGNLRIDTLDPDLIHGKDRSWWLEVFNAVSNGEMPPADEVELQPEGRSRLVDWLSTELQTASLVTRSEQGQSSFRRMTRYEYNYALQDLLGLPYDFAGDLPPETVSVDGFLNSSETLQMSVSQFETYRRIARQALSKATVRGQRPAPVFYAVTMDDGLGKARKKFEDDLEKLQKRFVDNPAKLEKEIAKRRNSRPGGAHYQNLETGFAATARWSYGGARFARKPVERLPETLPLQTTVAVIPRGQKLIIDLGDHLPSSGILHMRLRAGVVGDTAENDAAVNAAPTLRVFFGHQASNNSKAEERVGRADLSIAASAENPKYYEYDIPLSEVVRNPFRGIQPLGKTPNPAEYVMLKNTSSQSFSIQIDYVEITAPYHETWPPETHQRIFPETDNAHEAEYARNVIAAFVARAWRRSATDKELERKLTLFRKHREHCEDAEEAIVEVLADVLSSPNFLYVPLMQSDDFELATRLAMFLWCSLPDQELLNLAQDGRLSDPNVIREQTERMLNDARSQRIAIHFVRQWLGMQLMDHVQVEDELRDAMHQEPIALFRHILNENRSVMDFLHADYTLVNEALARHYGMRDVFGQEFRPVSLASDDRRGGLLTQAGLLAMNSDGKDSHPLKRGIWLLESILNDPPPPPPPAVPEIDLSDPDFLKLTLKERMEDHRNDPACRSCHQRIDPWGIAFENFDALGKWRTSIGKKPVDANSVLFNNQELQGMNGLKRFLLANRQDQFARAVTHKLAAYALGRPLSFSDRGEVDRITGKLREQGDGLRTLIHLIVASKLFQD